MKISLKQVKTKDLATLAERTISSSQSGNYKMAEGHSLLQKVINEYNEYKQVYSKLSYSGKGKSVAEADSHRDRIYSGIKTYLAGFRILTDLEGHTEAMALYEVFKKYGLDLDRMSYSSQTAQLNKLLIELNAEPNKAKIATLKLTSHVALLQQAQTNFETLYAEQAEANAELSNLPSATAIRKKLENALKNYFNFLTAMKDEEDWGLLYEDIRQIVKGISNTISKKKTTEEE